MERLENNEQEQEQEPERVCSVCGEVIPDDAEVYDDCEGNLYCENCEDQRQWCDHCEQYLPSDADLIEVHVGRDGIEYWCEECADSDAYCCDHCGHFFERDRVVLDDRGNCICIGCFEYCDYHTCEDCGAIISDDETCWIDDYPYCTSCADDHEEERNIHDYGYKPNAQFYFANGEGEDRRLYLGFELEAGGVSYDSADECAGEVADSHCYCKHDGSIPGCGFELVSHPHTLRAHKEYGWEDTLSTMRNYDLRSHDIHDCGLHVHASANFMNETCWVALDTFLDTYKCEMTKFARRHSSWGRFASESPDRYGSRYRALNFCPGSTREFRLFKGTLKYSTFMATLEFVDAACRVAKMYNGQVPLWESFCAYIDENAELYAECKAYMESKHIFRTSAIVMAAD